MTQQEIDAIRARCEAATAGKWKPQKHDGWYYQGRVLCLDPADNTFKSTIGIEIKDPDAEFIAHAREDIPRLLDALERSYPPDELVGKFDRLAGRGMHELRFDELTDYAMSLAGDASLQRVAIEWIVKELERKTNDGHELGADFIDLRDECATANARAEQAEAKLEKFCTINDMSTAQEVHAKMLKRDGWARLAGMLCAAYNHFYTTRQMVEEIHKDFLAKRKDEGLSDS